jgi:hypothetical protein
MRASTNIASRPILSWVGTGLTLPRFLTSCEVGPNYVAPKTELARFHLSGRLAAVRTMR